MARFEVLRVPSAGEVVNGMTTTERKRYEAARDQLKGEGCKAAGKRLLAAGGGNYALCQMSLYRRWRMTVAFPDNETVVIVHVGEHDDDQAPSELLSTIFPGLSKSGRRRSDQPPCCDDPEIPPMSSEVAEVLIEEFAL